MNEQELIWQAVEDWLAEEDYIYEERWWEWEDQEYHRYVWSD